MMRSKSANISVAFILAVFGVFMIFYLGMVKERPQTMYVSADTCRVRAGAGEEFDTVGLLAKEEQVVAVEATTGEGDQIWYRIDKTSLPEDLDLPADECYIRSDLLAKN